MLTFFSNLIFLKIQITIAKLQKPNSYSAERKMYIQASKHQVKNTGIFFFPTNLKDDDNTKNLYYSYSIKNA